MKNKSVNKLLKNLEVFSVILLLLLAEFINIPIPPGIINTITYGTVILLIIGRLKRFAYVATRDVSLLLLVGVAVASVLWSASLSNTVAQIRAVVRSILFGVYLAMQYTPSNQIRLLSWITGIVTILSFTLGLALPSYAISSDVNLISAWQGIFLHKQTLGRYMSFAASIFLITAFDKKSNRWFALAVLCLVFILILLSQSKTGLVAFILLLLQMPLYTIAKQKRMRALHMVFVLLLLTTVAIIFSLNLETIVVDFLGKNLEFNGRTPVWELAIEKGMERPFLGYGYNGFWTSEASDFIIMNTWYGLSEAVANRTLIFHAHNSFIDIFLQLGLIGLILVTWNLIAVIIRVVKLILITRKIEYFWMFQFIAVFLVYGMVEGGAILTTNSILWITYISIVFSSAIDYSKIKTKFASNWH
ncbi:O-antigen ligase family protein [Iningainema tapete]|uniref:O-antigen ligase family protein n=1 Tax=Iningainema tapete BLCC-T55 TaxID=2748662 RepID=A0A8J6XIA3_9CYAN|nr:O-antigen ligase family protein [Iningainema tapete]MBD2773262.1 O-antigen ligase family protein [Iningainema tapete BLCC-T55]